MQRSYIAAHLEGKVQACFQWRKNLTTSYFLQCLHSILEYGMSKEAEWKKAKGAKKKRLHKELWEAWTRSGRLGQMTGSQKAVKWKSQSEIAGIIADQDLFRIAKETKQRGEGRRERNLTCQDTPENEEEGSNWRAGSRQRLTPATVRSNREERSGGQQHIEADFNGPKNFGILSHRAKSKDALTLECFGMVGSP